ncbi:hypothetical protein L596_023392 [Steinernema carpocapsae]|uniref:Uncharacterized protein n=1 Tax=Steinernema carpocapsae TaxID=34508 RepID=A0A4U5MDI7_STECR|nr:hypothetical protein L596_023392 [Steinernema carpocapsae]
MGFRRRLLRLFPLLLQLRLRPGPKELMMIPSALRNRMGALQVSSSASLSTQSAPNSLESAIRKLLKEYFRPQLPPNVVHQAWRRIH